MEFPIEAKNDSADGKIETTVPATAESIDVSEQYAQEQLLSSIASVQSAKQLLREDTDPLDLLDRDEMKKVISLVRGRRQKGYTLGGGCGNNHSNLLSSSSITNIAPSASMVSLGLTEKSSITPNDSLLTMDATQDPDNQLIDKLLISNENFVPKSFLLHFHRHTSYSSLVQGIDRLKRATSSQELNLHALVRDNFDRFVRAKNATENLANKLKKDNLTSSGMAKEVLLVRGGYKVTEETFACLLEQREREIELRQKLELFRKWAPILRLGDCLEKSLALGEYNDAVQAYDEAKKAMELVSKLGDDEESLSLMQRLWSGHIESSIARLRSNLVLKMNCPIYDWKTYLRICEILQKFDAYPPPIDTFIEGRFSYILKEVEEISLDDGWCSSWFEQLTKLIDEQLLSNFVPIFNHILLERSSIKEIDTSSLEERFRNLSRNIENLLFEDLKRIPIVYEDINHFIEAIYLVQRDRICSSKYFVFLSTQTQLKELSLFLVDGLLDVIFNGLGQRILSLVWNNAISRFGEVSLNSKEYITDYKEMLGVVDLLKRIILTSPIGVNGNGDDDEMQKSDGKDNIVAYLAKTSLLYDPATVDRTEYFNALLTYIREFSAIIEFLDASAELSTSLEVFIKRYCEVGLQSIVTLLDSGITFSSYDLSLQDTSDFATMMDEPSPWIISLLDRMVTIKRDVRISLGEDVGCYSNIISTMVLQIMDYWLHLLESIDGSIGKLGIFVLLVDLSTASLFLNGWVDDFYDEISASILDLYKDGDAASLKIEMNAVITQVAEKHSKGLEMIFSTLLDDI